MSKLPNRIDTLRVRAEKALKRGEASIGRLEEPDAHDVTELLHELRVYHAELEIQNQELIASQYSAESERQRYQLLFSSLPIPAFVIDDRGIIEEANEAATVAFGFGSSRSFRQHSMLSLVLEGSRAELISVLREKSDQVRAMSLLFRGHDDRERHMQVFMCALPRVYHLDRRFMVLCLDRTDLVETSRSMNMFKTLFDNSDALIWAFDSQGVCRLANKALQKAVGRNEAELVGSRRAVWLPDEDARIHERNDEQVMSTRRPMLYEETLHLPGAQAREFLSNRFPLLDEKGELIGIGGISTDVTETRRKDARLELASKIFRAGSEGILVTDSHMNIISVNDAFTKITGYTEDEVVGLQPSILSSGRHPKSFYEAMLTSINTTGQWAGEIWNRRKSGEVYPEWLSISRVIRSDGETTNFIGVFSDITNRKSSEEAIERLAHYDSLTSTPNRYLLYERAAQAIQTSERSGLAFAVCFIDLDRFKSINDAFGHSVGDDVLRQVTKRIKAQVRDRDTVSRIGGDEFVLLMEGLNDLRIDARATALIGAISQPIRVANNDVSISASIGIALYPRDSDKFEELLQQADMAMYQAKSAGRNGWRYFNDDIARLASRRLSIELGLRRALERQEMHLHFQPQVDLSTGLMTGVEALLRWQHAGESFAPDIFIPVAEESGLISELGGWVIDQAIGQRKAWLDQGFDEFVMAINVSFIQFWQDDFVETVGSALLRHNLPGHLIELELTERIAMKDPEMTIKRMTAIKDLGISISLDDFGTGYSSLSYLNLMPIDAVKIDKAFTNDIGRDPSDEAICRTVIQLALTMNIRTIAEGVETEAQMEYLKKNGCNAGQGYYFSRPAAATDLSSQFTKIGIGRPAIRGVLPLAS